jgi:hypothetical protein
LLRTIIANWLSKHKLKAAYANNSLRTLFSIAVPTIANASATVGASCQKVMVDPKKIAPKVLNKMSAHPAKYATKRLIDTK